jgi:hypothetical protein
MKAFLLVLLLSAATLVESAPATAQDTPMEINADAIKVNLERQAGKRVRLRLVSGQDVEGTVVAVGTVGVHIARLTGMDFFDGVVRLDQIAAVIVRVR